MWPPEAATSKLTVEDEWSLGRQGWSKNIPGRGNSKNKSVEIKENMVLSDYLYLQMYVPLVCCECSRNIGFILLITQ